MTDLTQEDAQKFFNDVSKAMKDDDSNKLSDLYKDEPAPEDTKQDEGVDDKQPDPEEQPEEPSKEDEQPEKKDEEEDAEPSPPKEADEPPKEKELTPEEKKIAELEAQLSDMKKETHVLKSQAGRVPNVQRRINELTKKLDELTKASPSSQTSTKIEPKLDGILKELRETDSKLADTIAQAIKEATSTVDEEQRAREIANLQFMRDQETASYLEHEKSRLLEMYPNAPDVFKSTHWAEWKANQSAGIKALANSSSADEVAYAFKKYAEDMMAQYPDLAKKQETVVETPNSEATEKAKKIEEERARKKSTAANVSSPTAAGKQSVPDDPEALFKKFSEQFAKERQPSKG